MLEKEIRIPRIFHELHGEHSRLYEILLVYGVGAAFGMLVLVFARSWEAHLSWWKSALLFLIALDASGGVIANFTPGTDKYYARRPGLRWAFIAVHFIEPAILALLFDGSPAYWCFLYAYTAASASVVNIIQGRRRQETTAAALLVLGIIIVLPIGIATPFLAWFGPVFMLKLILAFAVRRTE